MRFEFKPFGLSVLLIVGLWFASPIAEVGHAYQDANGQAESSTDADSDDSSEAPTTPPRPIEIGDVDAWERAGGFRLSRDGAWCGYLVTPNDGDGRVVVKQVEGDTEHRWDVGRGSSSPVFSFDNQWVAFRVAALKEDAEKARKANRPAPSKVVVLELATGESFEIERASSFQFSGESAQWLAVRKTSSGGGSNGWSGSDLVLHALENGQRLNFGNVSSFAFNKSGAYLAMVIDAQDKLGNGLHLFDTSSQTMTVMESESSRYQNLAWHEEGDALTLLKQVESEEHENKLHHIIAYRNVGSADQERFYLDMSTDPGVAEHLTITSNRTPTWTENVQSILFGVHDAQKKPEEKPESDDEEDAGLVIWHWQDERMQSQQQVQESSDKRSNYLCIHHVGDGTTHQLGDERLRSVSVSKPHRFAIATDNTEYELDGNLDGQRYQDIYVIDLVSGEKKLVLEKHRWAFGASPAGNTMLYYLDGHYYIYEMQTGTHRNITENVPVSFIDTEDDHNVVDPPIRPVGWSRDGTAVLLSDNWDIWLVPTNGGEASNLTVDGHETQRRYRAIYNFDENETGIDLSKPNLVSVYGEWTKQSGFGELVGSEPGIEMLVWEDASFGALSKAADADVYAYSRQTQQQSPNYFIVDDRLANAKQVTDTNPHQDQFLWSDGVRLVDYESASGDRLQAALFLPADYVEGRSYPTVVYIYEKLSQRANSYDAPRVGGFSSSIYTSQGYAVLMPDIVYRINDPGVSSVECVVPAVEAAIATGIVDGERVGLHGHSWGGYQTSFLITQTNLFKAAVAGAPLTNLISMYSSIYWNSGSANQPIFESSQGRFTGGYWSVMRAYTTNSPVYYARRVRTPLLLLHNDEDGAVDWNQGIEYFNTLRRLKRPVVMLQYKGENHGLANLANRTDYSYRMLDFFDHYLKGEDAPAWWSEGIDHLDMEDHIRDYRRANQSDEANDE